MDPVLRPISSLRYVDTYKVQGSSRSTDVERNVDPMTSSSGPSTLGCAVFTASPKGCRKIVAKLCAWAFKYPRAPSIEIILTLGRVKGTGPTLDLLWAVRSPRDIVHVHDEGICTYSTSEVL